MAHVKQDLFFKELGFLYVEKIEGFAFKNLTILAVPVNNFSNDTVECSN